MVKWVLKVIGAGAISFILLNLFCVIYYNVPVHIDNPTGATEYAWEKNKFYSRATEGFAWGVTNDEGFINSQDYSDIKPIHTLLMGSSHMEAYQVTQKNSTTGQLNKLLGGGVYSIGTSEHTLPYCVSNLEDALATYNPQKYVVMETASIYFPEEQLNSVLNDSLVKLESSNLGIIGSLQKLPYLRLLYFQYKNTSKIENKVLPVENKENNSDLLNEFLKKVMSVCREYDVKPIIFFHPSLLINRNGEPYTDTNERQLQLFKEACENQNIIFVDMTEDFKDNYSENYRLPHGFYNTSAGKGHLNKYGHKMIAERLYKIINEAENNKDGI